MAEIPSDALVYNGHKYYIYSNVADTWEDAQAYCEARGGHLAVINDAKEDAALYNYMKEKGYSNAYFGLSDAKKEGTWTWVDGTEVKYKNWAEGEPNNLASEIDNTYDENYGMFYQGFTDGKWNDGNFVHKYDEATGFICEWEQEENSWTISGTTAKYGTSDKTLVTVKGVKSVDGLKVDKKVVTVANSALNKKKITISGSGYTLKLANDVTTPSTKKADWSLKSSTATYKSSYQTAGYKLASNSKSISYSEATTAETLASIKGAKSTTGISVSGKKITLKKSALKSKVTVSSGYEFNFASDYKSSTITGSSNSDSITVNGTKLSISGGKGNDTIKVLGNSNTVKGGAGSDVFIYSASKSGVISDYAAEDTISLMSGAAEITTSGDDIILNGKITVKGGKDKSVTYYDADGEHVYKKASSGGVKYNSDGTSATLTAKYTADEFTPSDYSQYADMLVTIDASKIDYSLNIVGNKRANKITATNEDDIIDGGAGSDSIKGGKGNDSIFGGQGSDELYGGEGNDTLWGGEGNDYLYGGADEDIFVIGSNEGTDKIADYEQGIDKIMILSGEKPALAGTPTTTDVTFKVGDGKITVVDGAHITIEFVDSKGAHLDTYYPSK